MREELTRERATPARPRRGASGVECRADGRLVETDPDVLEPAGDR